MQKADYRRAAADRILPVRARGDLQIVEMQFGGESAYMVHDPVTAEAFQFSREEHALLTALRQPVSLRLLQRELETAFAPRRATVEQIQDFVNRLYDQGLLVGENPGRGGELRERGRRQSRRERWADLLQVLSIRVGGFDAGPVVDRLYSAIRWACSRTMLLALAALAVISLIVAIGRASSIENSLSGLSELARPGFWPIWFAAVAVVKVFHEFGHALACRHFGARPREMGILLLAGMPTLFCDVSDAWRLPSKWRRIGVSAGGMFVELLIAAVAAIVWSRTEPGVVHAIALSLLIVCSVGTLAINANPLLRYDGYYILSDLLEVPNLAERARGLIGSAWRRWLLGEPATVDPWLSPTKRRALWIYAIGSKIYMALVLSGLFILMLRVARPHQLQNVVHALAVVVLAGMLMGPALVAWRMVTNPSVRARLRWDRAAAAALLLAIATTALYFMPMERRIAAPLVIVPADAHPLFAVAAGELQFAAPEGSEVAAGAVVVRLNNPELELALAEAHGAVREHRLRLHQLQTLQATSPAAARQLPTARAELSAAESQLAEHQTLVDSLTVRAPQAGRVVAAPSRQIDHRLGQQLPPWHGSPLDAKNLGAWIEARAPLCVIASGEGAVAWAGVEQADIPAVAAGQTVRLLVDEQPFSPLSGRVTQVARRARLNHDESESGDAARQSLLGDDRYHVVQIAVDDAGLALLPGAHGTAKITTERSNIGSLMLDSVRRALQRVL
jgi:putative peptide zinc metalloprotease protein